MNWCMNWCMAIIIWVIGGVLGSTVFVRWKVREVAWLCASDTHFGIQFLGGKRGDVCVQQVSSDQNPGCLGYIGDYTTQVYRDYNKPIKGSPLTNQYNGMSERFWSLLRCLRVFFRIHALIAFLGHWNFATFRS